MRIIILNEDSFFYNNKIWFTSKAYINYVKASPSSTRLPYDHVTIGKAKTIKIWGRSFFSPIDYQVPKNITENFIVLVKSNSTILYKNRKWYNLKSYLKSQNVSNRSTRLPYDHVETGKADRIEILGRTFFSKKQEKED